MGVCGLPARFGESERGILAQTETATSTAVVDPHNPCPGERAVRSGVDAQEEARGAVNGMPGGAAFAPRSEVIFIAYPVWTSVWTSWLAQL